MKVRNEYKAAHLSTNFSFQREDADEIIKRKYNTTTDGGKYTANKSAKKDQNACLFYNLDDCDP